MAEPIFHSTIYYSIKEDFSHDENTSLLGALGYHNVKFAVKLRLGVMPFPRNDGHIINNPYHDVEILNKQQESFYTNNGWVLEFDYCYLKYGYATTHFSIKLTDPTGSQNSYSGDELKISPAGFVSAFKYFLRLSKYLEYPEAISMLKIEDLCQQNEEILKQINDIYCLSLKKMESLRAENQELKDRVEKIVLWNNQFTT